jgi:hypothetical protein
MTLTAAQEKAVLAQLRLIQRLTELDMRIEIVREQLRRPANE